jgi:hypothetical protein
MAKQSILLVVLSLLAVVFIVPLNHILDFLVGLHNHLARGLHVIFADDKVGLVIQDMIALLLIPALCGLVITLTYWLAKRAKMPYTMTAVWIVWLVLLTTMIAQNDENPAVAAASDTPSESMPHTARMRTHAHVSIPGSQELRFQLQQMSRATG